MRHGDTEAGQGSSEQASGSKATPCTQSASGGEDPEAGQGDDYDYDPDYDSEPKLPHPTNRRWRPGMDVTVTMLEDEAYRLAIEGVLKPIYQQGVEVGERRVRSERLLQFLLIASAFKKYGRREVGPLQAEEEPGRPEFMAKLNSIYSQDEELHRKFTEVFERNNARRHAERLADLERKNRSGSGVAAPRSPASGKAPPRTHGAFGAEDTESKAPPCTHTAFGGEDAAGQKGNLTLDHDLDHNLDLVLSGPACGTPPSREDTVGTGGSDQLSVNSNQSSASNEWDVLDFEQFSAEVAAARAEDTESTAAPRSPAPSGTPPRTHGASGAEDVESKAPPCTHGASGAEDAERPRSASSRGCLDTPEYPESGGQSRAQMADNKKITNQKTRLRGGGAVTSHR